MKERKKSILKKIVIVLLSFGVLAGVALLDPNIKDIGSALSAVSPFWIIGAFCCMLFYYFMDAMMYYVAIRLMKNPQNIFESILTTMVGFFYSALTPFQSGGQPMQVLQMRRRGIPVGVSTSVLMVKFLAWQISISLLGLLGFIFVGANAFGQNAATMAMLIIGYGVNAACVVLAAFVFFKPQWVHRAGDKILGFLHRIKLIKREERYQALLGTWANTIHDYRTATHFAIQHKLQMLLVFGISLVEAVAYMAVTYFIYRGFGFNEAGFFYIVLLQCLLFVAVSFIPLPGASIASEGGFYLVFNNLFSAASKFPAMLVWRVCTYYMSIILGLIAVVIDGMRSSKYKLPEPKETSDVSCEQVD